MLIYRRALISAALLLALASQGFAAPSSPLPSPGSLLAPAQWDQALNGGNVTAAGGVISVKHPGFKAGAFNSIYQRSVPKVPTAWIILVDRELGFTADVAGECSHESSPHLPCPLFPHKNSSVVAQIGLSE